MPAENTGQKGFAILIQMSTLTGQPTGVTKPNIPSDPDYIPPVTDLDACPLPE